MRIRFHILLVLIISCSEKNGNVSEEGFSLIKAEKPMQLSTYFSDITAVVLDSSEVVGKIDKLIVTDSIILISDFDVMKSLNVFNLEGKLLHSRDDIGEGPFGMSQINDFCFYNGRIYVLDGAKRYIYIFDKELNLIEELPIKYLANNLWVNEEGIYIYYYWRPVGFIV